MALHTILKSNRIMLVSIILSIACIGFMFLRFPLRRFAFSHRPVPITDPHVLRLCEDFKKLPLGPEKSKLGKEIAECEMFFIITNKPYCHRYSELTNRLGAIPIIKQNGIGYSLITEENHEIFCMVQEDVIERIYATVFHFSCPPEEAHFLYEQPYRVWGSE